MPSKKKGEKYLDDLSPKQRRQYEHIKQSYLDRGDSEDVAQRKAAATVKKESKK